MKDREGRFSQKKTRQSRTSRKETKKSVPIKKIIGLFIIFLFLLAIYVGPFIDALYGPLGIGRVYPKKAEFTLERTIILENMQDGSGRNGETEYNVTLSSPFDISEYDLQYVNDISYANAMPDIYYKNGTEWNSWDRVLQAGQTETIKVSYEVETETQDWDYSESGSGKIENISDDLKAQYNKNQWHIDRDGDGEKEWMIEPEDPEIKELAEKIVEDEEENIYAKSEAIYNWVNRNIDYRLGGSMLPKDASSVLETRTGDCDEQSFLYISLLRALGIPAWMEMGVLYDRGGERWGGHGWVRMRYVDQEGNTDWVNVDPVNDQFFFRDALRFTSWVDNGEEGHLEDFYYYITWKGEEDDLDIDDDIDPVDMNTEGNIRPGVGEETPGFELSLAIPALTTSVLIYYWRRRKKAS